MNAEVSERFWLRVQRSDSCWNWTAGTGDFGHGRFYVGNGKHVQAHRFSYELRYGAIPAGLVLDHLCRNTGCVNPDHLEPVTSRENTLRGEGVTAKAAHVSNCPQGHPYDEANTYITPKGARDCRACRREAWMRWNKGRTENRNA